jgi:hypothetical protein
LPILLPEQALLSDLKVTAMRALDAGAATAEIARKYQSSPKYVESVQTFKTREH